MTSKNNDQKTNSYVEFLSKPNIERLIWLMNDPESSLIKLLQKEDNESIKHDLHKSLMEIRSYLSFLNYLQRLFVFHNEKSFTENEMNCLLAFAIDATDFLDFYGIGPIHNNNLYNRSLKSDFVDYVFMKGISYFNVDEGFIQRIIKMSDVEFEVLVSIAFQSVCSGRSMMQEFWLHRQLVNDEAENQEDAAGKDDNEADA